MWCRPTRHWRVQIVLVLRSTVIAAWHLYSRKLSGQKKALFSTIFHHVLFNKIVNNTHLNARVWQPRFWNDLSSSIHYINHHMHSVKYKKHKQNLVHGVSSYMPRHQSAIYRESVKTKEHNCSTPIQALIALTVFIKIHNKIPRVLYCPSRDTSHAAAARYRSGSHTLRQMLCYRQNINCCQPAPEKAHCQQLWCHSMVDFCLSPFCILEF